MIGVPDADIVAFASVAATDPTTVEVPVAVLVAFANVTATLPVTIKLPDADIVALASVTDVVAVTIGLPDAVIVVAANVTAIVPLGAAGAAGDLSRSSRLMPPPYRPRCTVEVGELLAYGQSAD
jgi:hypothetical protein